MTIPTVARRDLARPIKRSFSLAGHRTSISLEAAFWDSLKDAAAEDRVPLAALVATIDKDRGTAGLSSAVRVWLLKRLSDRAPKSRNAAE